MRAQPPALPQPLAADVASFPSIRSPAPRPTALDVPPPAALDVTPPAPRHSPRIAHLEPRPAAVRRHVLHLSRVGFIGGAERVLLTLARGLVATERVSLIAPEGELLAAARALGVETLAVDFNRMKARLGPADLLAYPLALHRGRQQVRAYCAAEQVDLIHVHHPVGALYALPAARGLGLPLIVHAHDGPPVKAFYRLALGATTASVARYVCVSDAARATLDLAGIGAERSITIPNGVDWSFLEPVQAAEAVSGPGPHIGVFAVLEPRKGQDVFLGAAARIAATWPEARFWLVGGSHLKEAEAYVASLKALAAVPALAGRVHFAGHRADVGAWLAAMDLVCLTSVSHESLGMSLLEAMALERTVVSSRIGVVGQFITEGQTGFLADAGDAASLAAAIERALAADRRQIGLAAAATIRARYGPHDFCDRIRALYASLAPI